MADEKDPEKTEAKKPRTPRRKKPAAAKAKDASATPEAAVDAEETTATVDEPTAETATKRAAGKTPAAKTTAAAKAAVADPPAGAEADKPKPARRTRRKAEPEAPPAPAAKAKRPARDPAAGPPMVRAHAKYVRTSARKARLVCDHIRGKDVDEARAILAHASRDVARDWSKLLESAVANAEHNHELLGDDLKIYAVKADEGPTLKRFRPRAMGRATKIRKRTSHLSITLTPKDED